MQPLHSQSLSFCSYFYSVVNWIRWKDPMNASLRMKQGFSLTKKVQCSGSPSNPWMFACSYSPRSSTKITILNEGTHGVWPRHPRGEVPPVAWWGRSLPEIPMKGLTLHRDAMLRLNESLYFDFTAVFTFYSYPSCKSCYISCVNVDCVIVWNFILNTKMKVKTINCDLANN